MPGHYSATKSITWSLGTNVATYNTGQGPLLIIFRPEK
jgi:hypothetical protein